MTVSTVVDHNDYTGNGVTTSFPYTFRIFSKSDLTVSVVDLSENITELVLDTDYTVTNAGGYTGGTVVLTAPLASGWQISVARELEPTQETDLRNQGKFFAEVHEDAFDKLTMLIQQVGSMFRLALRKPSSIANWYDALGNYIRNLRDPRDPQDAATKNYVDTLANSNLSRTLRVPEQIPQLPDAATRANKMPAFDSVGNPIVVLPPSGSASEVLIELAKLTGSGLVGYAGGAIPSLYDQSTTVNGALNRLTERVVYAHKYGVKADGITDDTTALKNLSRAVSAMTNPVVRVVFPQGTSLVGAQQQAPNATSGYSFRPSYIATEGNQGWFYVKGRQGTTIIDATGWTIKLNPGLKHGSFDPITGNAIVTTLPFRDTNYQAWAGHLVAFKENEHIIRIGLSVDGSAEQAIWGGKYGDSGWQCASFGIWDTGNKRIEAYNDHSYNALLDNIYIGAESTYSPPVNDLQRQHNYYNGIYTDGRRQNITVAGGQNLFFHSCQGIRAGRKCIGAGNFYSAPEANFDIESESTSVYDVVLNDCKLIDGGLNTFVAASFVNPFSRATLSRCLLRTDSSIAQMYFTGSAIKICDSLIEGSGFDFRTSAHKAMVELRRCIIRNHINGTPSSFQRYVGDVGVMEDCIIDVIMNAGMTSLVPMFSLTGGEITQAPSYPTQGLFRYNRILLTGNQDLPVAAANGRTYLGNLNFYFDMDLRIITEGLSGSRLVDIDTAGSTINQRGITCDTNKVVDRSSGSSIAMPSGGYMLPRSACFAAESLIPISDNSMAFGSSSRTVKEIYMGTNGGIRLKDANGKVWRMTVSSAGVLVVTAV